MNILHHKSYHVYSKKNIEKVKRDEAKAEEKAKADQERVQLAESEVRLNLLRQKANERLSTSSLIEDQKPVIQHVNLFQDLISNDKNEEREAEEKEKDDKWDKQITLYLDKGTKKEDDPWYAKEENKNDKYIDTYTFKRKRDKDVIKKKKGDPIKLSEDPLEMINTHLKKREEKKKKKENHKRKVSSTSSSTNSIEELRAKRLERERSEKVRVQELYLGPNMEEEEPIIDDRKRSYNSQFNRQETYEAAKNKKKRHY